MESRRPDPDELLKSIELSHSSKGRLKIFFGYAAGVGKTYAMLEAAHAAREAGIDVAVGYIEPHTRADTLKLLDGLEALPTLKLPYKSIVLNEFDLDGALERKPALILVDELAHSNAQGCRHLKRYQDIEELLNAGIDVYTTVNVQHIESLNDIIASITGVTVRERIPDKIFDSADQVELVDIEPEDLIARLSEGKVYKEKQAERALQNFFSLQNLVALREIALRRTADRVSLAASKIDYYTDEHIMICLSSSPSNAKVIRTAARMAQAFHGEFTALYVETPYHAALSEANLARLRANLKLAGQLGASIVTVYGDDVASQIAEYAKTSGVSKIVLGRTNTVRRTLFSKATFVEKLAGLAPNLDIYIIPDNKAHAGEPGKRKARVRGVVNAPDVLKSLAALTGATLLGLWFQYLNFSEANIITVYILSVLLTSILTKNRIYSLVSSVLSVLLFNYFFTDPRYTLAATDSGYPVTFIIMFIAAFITGTLTMRIKRQAVKTASKAYRTEVLLETSQKLQRAEGREAIISETAGQLIKMLGRTVIFYDARGGALGEPTVFAAGGGETGGYVSADERAVAAWAYRNNKHAGATTDTLPGAKCLYLAIRGTGKVFGVVGIAADGDNKSEPLETGFLIAVLGECGLALEKDELNKTKNEIAIKAQKEQLRANLLRSISHDLRTPLTSISGNAGVLIGNARNMDEGKKLRLYENIYDDSIWLINLVENLLSVTRIEEGTMSIDMEPELVEEVITEAMRHIDRRSAQRKIAVELPDDLIMARMDSRLIIQVLINLVDNAIKYTPAASTITVAAAKRGDTVEISVADDGAGVPDSAKAKLFDMFYTASNAVADGRRGMGLGLSLCKSIITAHGGDITVEDNLPHGAVFRFTLPAQEVTVHE